MIVVIGAGPVGLEAAYHSNADIVLEEHSEIGEPQSCAGLISSGGIESLKIYDKSYVLNEIRGADFFSPNRHFGVEAKKTKAYSLQE